MKKILESYQLWSQTLWKIFISVRTTITILLSLIAFNIAGSIIAQQGTTQTPLEKLYSPTTLKWLVSLGLTDVFHSWFFVLCLLSLAVNLIACSIERLPAVWRQTFHVPPPPSRDPMLKDWTEELAKKRKFLISRSGKDQRTIQEAKMAVQLFFQKHFKKYTILRDEPNLFQITVEQGKFSRVGVYITHLSLLLIMFGGGLGAIFGFEGGMSIEEGTKQSWIQHLRGSNGGLPLMKENGRTVPGFLNLGFEVECEDFTLETYDGERPKAFRSKLNFYENEVKVASSEIAVNSPYTYKGIQFYQASYAKVGINAVDLKIFRTKQDVELVQKIHLGEVYRIDGDAGFKITQVEENLMDLGPAAKVQYFASKTIKKPKEFWIFQTLPGFDFAHRKDEKIHFVLDALQPKYATGISVAKDPGVWVVWLGSAILILALFIALYTCHRRYWVTYTPENGFVFIGWSNKLFLFEQKYNRLLKMFYEDLKL